MKEDNMKWKDRLSNENNEPKEESEETKEEPEQLNFGGLEEPMFGWPASMKRHSSNDETDEEDE
jgi:hypothetical protein